MWAKLLSFPAPSGDHALRDAEVVRAAMLIAAAVAVTYAVAGAIIGDQQLLMRAILPTGVAAAGFYQLRTGRPRAALLLFLCATLIVVHVGLIDSPGIEAAGLLGLVTIGAAASIVVDWPRPVFYGLFTILIVVAQAWWTPGTETLGSLATRAVTHAVAFLFLSWVILWARQSQRAEEQRYELLFARAPVSICEEDFRSVGAWLEGLRDQGVTDLRRYMAEHPEETRKAAATIIVRDVNQATVDLLEASDKQQLLGPLSEDGITDQALRSLEEQLVAIWENRDHLDTRLFGLTTRGNPIDGLLRWMVPRDRGRLDLGSAVVAMVDISDLRRAERRLQELVRSKDQFIASVSHELRTPLTAVVGLTHELRQNSHTFTARERQEFMDLIAEQATDVANIVEDLLVAARADIGTVTVNPESVDLYAVVRSVVEYLGDEVATECAGSPDGAIMVVADEARVRQILRNLVTNAQRYGGDRITVRTGLEGSRGWVEVVDDGDGVPGREQDRIFEPYATAHQTSGVTAAVGLGLTVSRQLARLMSGDLTYTYREGESTFRLSLPQRSYVGDAPPAHARRQPPPG